MTNVKVAATVIATLITAVTAPVVATAQLRTAPTTTDATDSCRQIASMSSGLTPRTGYSVRVGGFDGVLYYTVAQGAYQVVTTFVSATEQLPIRFSATLMDGQHVTISVPQGPGQPSIDVSITRARDALFLGHTPSCAPTN